MEGFKRVVQLLWVQVLVLPAVQRLDSKARLERGDWEGGQVRGWSLAPGWWEELRLAAWRGGGEQVAKAQR